MEFEYFTFILFFLNSLLLILLAIIGFWFKSIYNRLEKLKDEFITVNMCKQKHQGMWDTFNNFKEALSEIKQDMKNGFDRIERKLDGN